MNKFKYNLKKIKFELKASCSQTPLMMMSTADVRMQRCVHSSKFAQIMTFSNSPYHSISLQSFLFTKKSYLILLTIFYLKKNRKAQISISEVCKNVETKEVRGAISPVMMDIYQSQLALDRLFKKRGKFNSQDSAQVNHHRQLGVS